MRCADAMIEIRCGACRRKLGVGRYCHLSIKCPRCGNINDLRVENPAPERPRASDTKDAHVWPQNQQQKRK